MGLPTAATVLEYDGLGRATSRRAYVDSDVLDIRRRLTEGDATCGWRGEPTARLFHNQLEDPVTGKVVSMWEVECLDRSGTPYIAASLVADYLDHRIIEKMVLGDWQRGKVALDEITAANQRLAEARAAERRDAIEAVADKLHWAMVRDTGHHEGATRRLYWMGGS